MAAGVGNWDHRPVPRDGESGDAFSRGSSRACATRSPRIANAAGLLRDAWIEYQRDRARYLAVAIIYYATISVVPILALALSTLGLALRYSESAVRVEQQMLVGIEGRFGAQVTAMITGVLETVQKDSIVATIISVIGMLVGASLLFRQLRLTFRAIWHYEPPLVGGPVRTRVLMVVREWFVAVAITLGGGGLLILTVIVISALRWLVALLIRVPLLARSGWLLAALISLVFAAISFGALLKVLPPRLVRWRDIWPAVLLCAVIWVAASELLPLYYRVFGERRNAFSAIGALLPMLLLVNVGSQSLFFGAELCKVKTRRGEPPGSIACENGSDE